MEYLVAHFAAMEPLGRHITSLNIHESDLYEGPVFYDDDTRALAAAFPALTEVTFCSGIEIDGKGLFSLIRGLQQLSSLDLCVPCAPHTDVVQAAAHAQVEVNMGLRKGPLTISMECQWEREEAEEVEQSWKELFETGALGSEQLVHVKVGTLNDEDL